MWKGTEVSSTEMPKTNVWSGDKDEPIHHDKVLRFKKFENVQTVFFTLSELCCCTQNDNVDEPRSYEVVQSSI